MSSWDELDREDPTEAKIAPATAQAVTQDHDKLDDEAVGSVEGACAASTGDSDAVARAKKALNNLGIQEGLNGLEGSAIRVQAGDKQMINVRADLDQLIPFKHDWAWQKYPGGCANHWMPQEVNMNANITLWKSKDGFSENERRTIMCNFGFFSTTDSLVTNSLMLVIYRPITSSEYCQYTLRQALEEAVHTHAYQYHIELLGMNEGEILNMYHEIPSVVKKALWSLKYICSISDPVFQIGIPETDRQFLRSLIAYYCMLEGILLCYGLAQTLSMDRRSKMIGTTEQSQYTPRDESVHLNSGIDVINQIKTENSHLWDAQMEDEATQTILQDTQSETEYARDTMSCGVLGMNAAMIENYLKFIANRYLIQIGLKEEYPGITNPLLWTSKITDLKKRKNFFEVWVIEYRTDRALS